jgi:5'-nucleotidase
MRSVRFCLALLVSAWLIAPVRGSEDLRLQSKPVPPYRILISNDDGVHAPGLAAVAQILQAIGQVTIVAPMENQSGSGHSITIAEPIFRHDLTLPNGLKAIGLSATPASTVKVALKNILSPKPDLVVTGINRGYNLGLAAYISGTVGAAREAAMFGIPAIAASTATDVGDYGFAAEEVLGVARRLKQYGLPPNTFLNVNVPPAPPGGAKGYQVTSQAMTPGGDESFAEGKHPSGRTLYWNVYKEGGTAPQGTDVWAVSNGYVAVTPMHVGEGEPKAVEALKAWFK